VQYCDLIGSSRRILRHTVSKINKNRSTSRVWCCSNSICLRQQQLQLHVLYRREKKFSLIDCVLYIAERKTSPPRRHRACASRGSKRLGSGGSAIAKLKLKAVVCRLRLPRASFRASLTLAHVSRSLTPSLNRASRVNSQFASRIVSRKPRTRLREERREQ